MSVDIDWAGFTTGEDGLQLAQSVQEFFDEKFRQIPLPRFLRDVRVQSFAFGAQSPTVELKDVSDPWAEFYHDSDEEDGSTMPVRDRTKRKSKTASTASPSKLSTFMPHETGYFQMPHSVGLSHSGTATPFSPSWPLAAHDIGWNTNQSALNLSHLGHSGLPWSTPSLPVPQRDVDVLSAASSSQTTSPMDVQTTVHVSYNGDVSLKLTAEILLDYPMPSFVGIPFELTITGLDFEGIALLAYFQASRSADAETAVDDSNNEVKFCFLDEETASLLLPAPSEPIQDKSTGSGEIKHKGLIKEIRVESEIGRQTDGRHGLKNVGKVEQFLVEQIRSIFEEELVFPSFYTFLV